MRELLVRSAAGVCLVLSVLGSRAAHAAPPKPSASRGGPILVQSSAAADTGAQARAKMAKGDCAAAIDLFDAALRSSIDASLRRDRGICHERLEQPYPAIDDYRAYLTERPDAPDADSIREKLEQLEQAVRSGQSASRTDGVLAPDWSNQAGITASPGLKQGGHEVTDASQASESKSGTPPPEAATTDAEAPKAGAKKHESIEDLEEQEVLDADAKNSPLRRGKGFILGPYFQYRSWGVSGVTQGTGYGVGGSFRQSMSQVSTLLLELGYVSFGNSSEAQAANLTPTLGGQRGGFGMMVGYEARIRLDSRATNALTLLGGWELNRLVYSQTDDTLTTMLARARFGYRHVFGPSFGLEIAADVSIPFYGTGSAISAAGGSTGWQEVMLGGYAAVVVGF
jgi:hypothetical protein